MEIKRLDSELTAEIKRRTEMNKSTQVSRLKIPLRRSLTQTLSHELTLNITTMHIFNRLFIHYLKILSTICFIVFFRY